MYEQVLIWEFESYNVIQWLGCYRSTVIYMWSFRNEATSFKSQMYTHDAAVKQIKSAVKGVDLPKHCPLTYLHIQGEKIHVSMAWRWKIATLPSKVCSQPSWCMTLIGFVKDYHQSPSIKNPIKVLGILSSQPEPDILCPWAPIWFTFRGWLDQMGAHGRKMSGSNHNTKSASRPLCFPSLLSSSSLFSPLPSYLELGTVKCLASLAISGLASKSLGGLNFGPSIHIPWGLQG